MLPPRPRGARGARRRAAAAGGGGLRGVRPTRPPARLGAATDRRRPRHGEGRAQADARGGVLSPGEALAVHNDRGVHCRTASWIARCEPHGLRRSMSRKGMSCDNARAEGFFGLLKQEFYYPRDWSGTTVGELMDELDRWMEWFRSGRFLQRLGWLTPDGTGCLSATRCRIYRKTSVVPIYKSNLNCVAPTRTARDRLCKPRRRGRPCAGRPSRSKPRAGRCARPGPWRGSRTGR